MFNHIIEFISMRYFWIILLMLATTSCKENLPATVDFSAEWKDYDLHLSADFDLDPDIEIIFQDFEIEYPVYNINGYWDDSPQNLRRFSHTIPIEWEMKDTILSLDWDAGLSCFAQACLQTNIGLILSPKIELKTLQLPPPEFTKFTQIPTVDGGVNGQLIIEGKYFRHGDTSDALKVIVNGISLTLDEITSNRIIAIYPRGDFRQPGEYEVKVKMRGKTYTLEQKMVI